MWSLLRSSVTRVLSTRSSGLLLIVVLFFLLTSCATPSGGDSDEIDYREEMRGFVTAIAERARAVDSDFIVIPQNGNELVTLDGEDDGPAASTYLAAIDGVGREDLWYGYTADDTPTPESEREYMIGFLDRAEEHGVEVLVTDYCTTAAYVDDSYTQNEAHGYISFAAERELDSVPTYPATPYNAHGGAVASLADARNFLYLLNPDAFASRADYLAALGASDHDLLIIDLYAPGSSGGSSALTSAEVDTLRDKASGDGRLVIAYMSIGEAEDYRPYWDAAWESDPPEWLAGENPDWEGNYKVRYWLESWQEIILGAGGASVDTAPDADSYLGLILDAGFDGVYLDIIDAFEYFE